MKQTILQGIPIFWHDSKDETTIDIFLHPRLNHNEMMIYLYNVGSAEANIADAINILVNNHLIPQMVHVHLGTPTPIAFHVTFEKLDINECFNGIRTFERAINL